MALTTVPTYRLNLERAVEFARELVIEEPDVDFFGIEDKDFAMAEHMFHEVSHAVSLGFEVKPKVSLSIGIFLTPQPIEIAIENEALVLASEWKIFRMIRRKVRFKAVEEAAQYQCVAHDVLIRALRSYRSQDLAEKVCKLLAEKEVLALAS